VSPPGRPKGERRSAAREGNAIDPPGRPKGEHRSAAREGSSRCLALPEPDALLAEAEFIAIRAQGAGGQNVNKVSNAVHLRFAVAASSLAPELKARLLEIRDQRISSDGVIVIKAQRFRSLEKNRADALVRLQALLALAADIPRPRRPTRPTAGSQRRRLQGKARHGQQKALRGRVID
jgi:ribosome-associated protein